MKTNFLTSQLFFNVANAIFLAFSFVASSFLGYWLAVASGANLTETNPFASSVLYAFFLMFFTVFLIGNVFFASWLVDWQLDKRNA